MSKATNSGAVYFEDVGKNRLKDFFSLIQHLCNSVDVFQTFLPYIQEKKITSKKLLEKIILYNFDDEESEENFKAKNLVPNISIILKNLKDNFMLITNADTNKTYVEPKKGTCKPYDAWKDQIDEIHAELDQILKQEN